MDATPFQLRRRHTHIMPPFRHTQSTQLLPVVLIQSLILPQHAVDHQKTHLTV